MNLPLIHRNVGLVILTSLVFITGAAGQRRPTNRDKSQIIRSILRTYDFTHSETQYDHPEKTIFLLDENISPADIPSRSRVKFRIVKQTEIDRLRENKPGIEYYEFRPFEITKTGVRTAFIRTYLSPTGGNGNVMEYSCRKIRGRWKIKADLGAMWAT